MWIKCLAQGHYCRCQQIRTGDLTIENLWSCPLSHISSFYTQSLIPLFIRVLVFVHNFIFMYSCSIIISHSCILSCIHSYSSSHLFIQSFCLFVCSFILIMSLRRHAGGGGEGCSTRPLCLQKPFWGVWGWLEGTSPPPPPCIRKTFLGCLGGII